METSRKGARLEAKLGFDRVRAAIADKCSTSYAVERVENERFSTMAREIRRRLLLTDEMRLILMFEDSFPSAGFVDCLDFLKRLSKQGNYIDLVSLGKLRTMLETIQKVASFFSQIKDGVYPNLKRMASSVMLFPEVRRRIDSILDRYGAVKDTASDTLYDIRKSLR
ncbi:MAG: endonuclease MutS2, partial [Bacteroidales bacterium]|nr:endonuclease MutS2 [Bacteroidales bacterium]